MTDMTEPMKLTERHVIEKASEILEDARQRGFYRFKCRLLREGSWPIELAFRRDDSIHYVRQLGWAQLLRESGGAVTPEQAWHFRGSYKTSF